MTELAEKLLKTFYELWHDKNWPYVKTRGVPGIFLAIKAGLVTKEELKTPSGNKIANYPSNPVHHKIAPALLEMIEEGLIRPIEGKYANYDLYWYQLWEEPIRVLCGSWGERTEIKEFQRLEHETGDEFPEMWFLKLTAKGREKYESLSVMKPLVDELLGLQEKINEKLGCEVLIDKYKIIHDLLKPCLSREHFTHRIQNLNLLIDKMRIKQLGGTGDKTIDFLESYLRNRNINPTSITQNLRNISVLSSGYPRHEGANINKRVKSILNKWGFDPTSIDYRKLWKAALERYIESLKNLLKNL